MVFHRVVMSLPPKLRVRSSQFNKLLTRGFSLVMCARKPCGQVVGGVTILLSVAAAPLVYKSKSGRKFEGFGGIRTILLRALPSLNMRGARATSSSRSVLLTCSFPHLLISQGQVAGGRGTEYFSSEKPEVVEAQADERKKERYAR